MKRARPIASLKRQPHKQAIVRLGGGWDGRFARLAASDPYRAQVSRFGRNAELTRLAFLLEALPATRKCSVVFVAKVDQTVPLAWLDKLHTIATRLGLPTLVETIASGELRLLTVENRGGVPRREPEAYDRILAKRDERFARKREKSGRTAAKIASEGAAEWEWWSDQQALEQGQ